MSSANAPAFQIGPGMWVRLRYEVFDGEGERVEDNPGELGYVHGFGALLPAFETELEGRAPGYRAELTLRPEQAFGPRRHDAVLELARDEFPEDVAPGDRFDAENAEGGLVVLRVLEVHPDGLVVDTNHPLAGQRVRFALSVLEVRPASAEEIQHAEERLSRETDRGGPALTADGPLISVERLLTGPSRRYEMGRSGPENAGIDPADDES